MRVKYNLAFMESKLHLLYFRVFLMSRIRKLKLTMFTLLIMKVPKTSLAKINPRVLEDFTTSGLTSSHGSSAAFDFYNRWDKADYLFGRGLYWDALEIRRKLMQDIYEYQGVEDENHFPPLMSSSFTVSIGHIGCIMLHQFGQELGILPPGKRHVLVGSRVGNSDALRLLRNKHNFVPSRGSDTNYFLPASNVIENLQVFRSKGSFVDRYELWERIYSLNSFNFTNEFSEYKHEYNEMCWQKLSKVGVSRDSKIALFHLRNNGNSNETRNVSAEPFGPLARHLGRNGYSVFQIGENESNSLSRYAKNVICLPEKKTSATLDLDLFLLYSCSIFIGTTSGPSIFPQLFRVPTLITNLTSISRNALSSDTSLYMPKFLYTENGRKLEMDELLSSRFSFGGEFAHSQLKREGLIMRQNDERQILEGAEELISRTKKGKIELSITDQEIRQLQQNSRTVAFGLFANSLF